MRLIDGDALWERLNDEPWENKVSFGDETTKDDIDKLVSAIDEYKERFVV